jgi:ABC-2 type transport system permease protein
MTVFTRNIWTLAKRELAFYFTSPIAYIVIPIFLVVCGVHLFVVHPFFDQDQATLRPLFERIPLFFILYIPALSMRLISEEKRSGTIELLVTMPLTDTQIVLGKYLGALLFLLVTLLATFIFPLAVGTVGDLEPGLVVGGYMGLLFVGAAYLAIGLLTSSWTHNQIVAYILAAFLCAFFYGVDALVGSFWEAGRDAFAFLSFRAHFANIARGVIDSRDVIFYGSMIVVTLVMTVQSLSARHWK